MEALAHLDRNGYGGLITQRLHDDDDDHDVDDDDPVDATVTMMTMVLMMLITVLFWLVARHLPQRGRLRLRPAQTQQVAQRRCVALLPLCHRRLFNAGAYHRFRLRGVMLRVRSLA